MRLAQIEKGQVEGRAKVLESSELDIRCLTAPNASPMTQNGTNTYLVGRGDIAVIDPGPDDSGHLEQILAALRPGEKVTHILVTHSHLDHSPLAAPLSDRTGAPVYGFGSAHDGRSETMINLAKTSDIGGGEGIDADFAGGRCSAQCGSD